ncbi:MAG: hypothetical protein KatS3mg124_1377 [Porticoccaceae bacterium]|nr:MAG: hypothetical protein KatS3mg124_1377 [Porticoccaceae bacterium]
MTLETAMNALSRALLLALLAAPFPLAAEEVGRKVFGDFEVHYNAYPSEILAPEVASRHGIARGKDKGIVSIAVVPRGAAAGTTARVEGTVTDLLQRQQVLAFAEVREGEAVYYLAPFRFDPEDPLTFAIRVTPSGAGETFEFRFRRTF